MPNLSGTPQRKKIDFSGVKSGEETGSSEPKPKSGRKKPSTKPVQPVRTKLLEDDEDDELEDDDEIIQASLQSGKDKKTDIRIVAALGVGVVFIVVMVFLLLGGKKEETPPAPVDEPPAQSAQEETWGNDAIGVQDFTQHTTMDNTSPLSDPNGFVEDISGLTTRVDYHVSAIQTNVVDFVNYTKKRGTWGGGLELYWLDCTYKGAKYMIQVPFQYYKELDDEGIVPVKMEVLYVKEPNGDTLTIISYMSLDASVLESVMNSKS